MHFTLEILQAQQGDCLLLHFGTTEQPRLIVVDGGPKAIYERYLQPRLEELRKLRNQEEPLPVTMVMVSHTDDDHINGILKLTEDMIIRKGRKEAPFLDIENFWFNSFDDLVGDSELSVTASVTGNVSAASAGVKSSIQLPGVDRPLKAVIASVGQGRSIRRNIEILKIPVNEPFSPLVKGRSRLIQGIKTCEFYGLQINVLHPTTDRLSALQDEWDKAVKTALAKKDAKAVSAALNQKNDKSPFNLSSIVCLVCFHGKRILLTGDARSDDIYKGLEQAKLLDKNGRMHVDILKMPHHGSDANMRPEFLEKVTADHYVISADGKHHNPDQRVLDMFRTTVHKGTLVLTNESGEFDLSDKLHLFMRQLLKKGSALNVRFRPQSNPSVSIDLLTPLNP